MKLDYSIPERDLKDLDLIRNLFNTFKEIEDQLSDFGRNTMREELDGARFEIEKCEEAWIHCQRKRLFITFNEFLKDQENQSSDDKCKFCGYKN